MMNHANPMNQDVMNLPSPMFSLDPDLKNAVHNGEKDLIDQTEEALENLDRDETMEYRYAKDIVPHLVKSETPISAFLQTEHGDPIKAAKRLACFWRFRKISFGDRWLLPMTQTGRGALEEHDIQFLRSGYFCVIPLPVGEGTVVYVDPSMSTHFLNEAIARGLSRETLMDRALLYLAVTYAEDLARGNTRIVHCITSRERPPLYFRTQHWEMFRYAFPIRFKETVVAQAYEANKQELLDFIRFKMTRQIEYNQRKTPRQIYGGSVINTIDLLKDVAPRELIPIQLGGQLNISQEMARWARMRVSMEDFIISSREVVQNVVPIDVVLQSVGKRKRGEIVKRKREETSQEDFVRRRNAVYSRRMYYKRKLEVVSLETQIKQLQDQNSSLTEDNRKLERAWEIAQHFADEYEAHTSAGAAFSPSTFPW